jgi:hypothetical protein
MSLYEELMALSANAVYADFSHIAHPDAREWDEDIAFAIRQSDLDAILARYSELVATIRCNCGFGGVHDENNPRCDRNIQTSTQNNDTGEESTMSTHDDIDPSVAQTQKARV